MQIIVFFLYSIGFSLLIMGIWFLHIKIKKIENKTAYLDSITRNNFYYLDEKINNYKSILKEAGIIIEPPTNISVPDPRGYSVKKVK